MSDTSGAPSDRTRAEQARVASELAFEDDEDFELARRGLVEAVPAATVTSSRGDFPCWNLEQYAFLAREEAPETVNPSLWRLARLNMSAGLYEVCERVYQVRGFDLANISFVETERGIVVIDALTSSETSAAALALYRKHRGERPIVAVIQTHSHVDHFGGIRGLVDPGALDRGEVSLIAPDGFLEEAASENVLVGNAMSRRATYMYGMLLERGPAGQVDAAIGKAVSVGGETGLLAPTETIDEPIAEREIDGLGFVFQLTPGTEAPAEMNIHVPELKLLCTAENFSATMHNLYTLRGAAIRDARAWSRYLLEAWDRFGDETDVLLTVHNWPRWGRERIGELLRSQADLYKFLHDQTVRLANRGLNMDEIAEELRLPAELERPWHNRGYYGSVRHNAKAIYQRYLGWFDGNPATLDPLPPAEAGAKYVELMGGAEALLEKVRESYEAGEYRWVVQVLNHLVFSAPDNHEARALSAAAMRQLAYQTENATWRNFYLTGAQELEAGPPPLPNAPVLSADAIACLPTESLIEMLAVRLDGPAAEGLETCLGLELTDTGESFRLELKNGVLNAFPGDPAVAVEAGLALPRSTLASFALDEIEGEGLPDRDDVALSGDEQALRRALGLFERFEMWFGVVTP